MKAQLGMTLSMVVGERHLVVVLSKLCMRKPNRRSI
jgi:hypothetical protein